MRRRELTAHTDRLFFSAGCFGLSAIFTRPRPPLVHSRSPTPDRPRLSSSYPDSREDSPSHPASLATHAGNTRRADENNAYRHVKPSSSPWPRQAAPVPTPADSARRSGRRENSDADVPTFTVQIDIPNPPRCRCRRRDEDDHRCRWRDQVEAETLAREETRRHRDVHTRTAPQPPGRRSRSDVAQTPRAPPSDIARRPAAQEKTAFTAFDRRSSPSDIALRPGIRAETQHPSSRWPGTPHRTTPWPRARPTYHGLNPIKKARQEAEDMADFARYGVIRRRSPDGLPLGPMKRSARRQTPGP